MTHRYLRRKIISGIQTSLNAGESTIPRRLSEAAATARRWPEKRRTSNKGVLYNKLWVAGTHGEKMSDVLNQLKKQGTEFAKSDLIACVRDLRKYHRHHHCLQILEWIDETMNDYSDKDHALRLGVVYNLKGIDEAEKYFTNLPDDAKTLSTYGALLNCYSSASSIDKALPLFEKMVELNYANTMAYNNLMGLYMKLGQPEKVPVLVEEMKEKNIQLTNYSYSILIQSYGCLNDLENVEKLANEVKLHKNEDWSLCASLANVYIKSGQSDKAESTLKRLETFLDDSYDPDREAYNHLITLCARLGNPEYVNRVWSKFKSRFKALNNLNFLNMLFSLSKIDDIEGMKKCLKEWELNCLSYDVRLPSVVIDACLKRKMIEDAESLLKEATERSGERTWNSHVSCMRYHLENGQLEHALKHMQLAIDNNWKRYQNKIELFFEYFIKERDVDGAESFFHVLKNAQALDSGVYMGLLKTYEAAGKTAPQMRLRIEKDGIDIIPELEELLEKICPN